MTYPVFLRVLAPWLLLGATPAAAQTRDTLRLADLHMAATTRDARQAQPALLEQASALRLQSIAAERLPQFSVGALASHQSDVTSLPGSIPGATIPRPPLDRWQGTLDVQQVLYDGGAVRERQAVERARLAESSAAVRTALYRLRDEVNAAFFSAFLLQERRLELEAVLVDLDARLRLARARVASGVALGRDTAAVVAEIVRTQIARDEARAGRAAALAMLSRFAGEAIDSMVTLALPDHSAAVSRALAAASFEALRRRPEFDQYRETRARIEHEASLTAVEQRPRVVAFGQAGVGRPGLNQFRTDPDEFWQAGVRVEWRPWNWGSASRNAEALRVQQRVVESEERALADALARAVERDVAELARLQEALAGDARLVALREEIERQSRALFTEGVVTAAEYVETRTDVLEARLLLQRHRTELAQAQTRLLTTLGLPADE